MDESSTPRPILVAIDLETTGLDARKHSICQLGCTVFEQGQILGSRTWDVFVSEDDFNNAEPEALAVNGFTLARCQAGMHITDVLDEFTYYCCSFSNFATWGAVFHNAPFDVSFLRSSGGFVRRSFVDLLLRRVLDTVTMGWLLGERDADSLSLESLVRRYIGAPKWKHHDAGHDSLVTAMLCQKFMGWTTKYTLPKSQAESLAGWLRQFTSNTTLISDIARSKIEEAASLLVEQGVALDTLGELMED